MGNIKTRPNPQQDAQRLYTALKDLLELVTIDVSGERAEAAQQLLADLSGRYDDITVTLTQDEARALVEAVSNADWAEDDDEELYDANASRAALKLQHCLNVK